VRKGVTNWYLKVNGSRTNGLSFLKLSPENEKPSKDMLLEAKKIYADVISEIDKIINTL
jgi:hypothetical protein